MNVSTAPSHSFIDGDGEMARLIRNHDWSLTPLGSAEYWPQSLLSTLDLVLHSAFPMFLFWGPQHTCFYNDAFRPMLGKEGKHPTALGSAGKEVWNEIWDSIEPLINLVLEGQSTGLYEDTYLPIYRNGRLEDAYWTFSYNPVKAEKGNVHGVLAIVHETTTKVQQTKEKELLQEQLQLALDACDIGTFDIDPQTRLIVCDKRAEEILGIPTIGQHSLNEIWSIIENDDRELVKQAIDGALNTTTNGKQNIDCTVNSSSGQQKMIRLKGQVYFNTLQEPVRVIGTVQDITDEKLLDNKRKKLQQLVDNAADFMSMATLDGQMVYLNDAARNLLGISAEIDITQLQVADFYTSQSFDVIRSQVIPALNEHQKWKGVIRIRHFKTGEEIPCFANYIIITDPDSGKMISRAASFRDLRPELQAQKELLDSEKRFRNLVQEAPVATAIYVGREMKIQWANDAMIKLWGKDESVIGKTVREALPELEGQPFYQQLDDVFTSGMMYKATEDPGSLMVDGKLQSFFFNFSYKPLYDADGNIYGILNMAIDVTDSVVIKRKLEESEKNFRNLIMQAPIGITLLNGDDHIIELANDQYLQLVGRDREGFIGKPIWKVIPEAKEQGFDVILKNVKDSAQPYFGNEIPVMLVRNGSPETVYINFVYEPLANDAGQVNSILVLAIDVTQQVEARLMLESTKERMRLAIESAQLGTYQANAKTGQIDGSERFYELFGIESDMNTDFISRIHPDDLDNREKAHQTALVTGKLEYECRIPGESGEEQWRHISGQYYFDEKGSPEKIIGIVKDITREKSTEQELERRVKERTEALTKLNNELQQFTYVSSHDLKEPLRKVQFYTGLLADEVQANSGNTTTYAQKIRGATSRMATLINDVLEYSTHSHTDLPATTIDLSSVVATIQDDMEILIKEKQATIEVASLPLIKGISFQINQLFYNLLNNALKFSKPGTSSIIQVNYSLINNDVDFGAPALSGTSFHKIEISDNGIGFDPQYADKIFGVFQRLHTRNEFEGNGIGLAICKRIVLNHQGSITAASIPGKGSVFTVLLPA